MHRQRPRALKHRVPMPPRPVILFLRERAQKAPRPSLSDRRQHDLLHLIQQPRFKQHPLLSFIQCLRRKQTQSMYLNRSPIHLIWAHHWLFSLNRQLPSLFKVKYRSQNLTDDLFYKYHRHPWKFSVEDIPSATPADQIIVQASSPCQIQEIALKQVSRPIY